MFKKSSYDGANFVVAVNFSLKIVNNNKKKLLYWVNFFLENKRFIRRGPTHRKRPIWILGQECLKIWRFHSIAMNDVASYGKVHNWMLFWDVILVNLFENFKITSRPHSHSDNVFFIHTSHGPINLPIPAIAYFINTLDSQSSGRGRGGQTISKLGTFFTKYVPHSISIFEKKSHPIRPVEGLKLCLDFLCNVRIT